MLKIKTRSAAISSVCMPQMDPLGTSRRGSMDSSAASGTSSIARKNQIAKGSDLKMPLIPNGSQSPPPPAISLPSSAMFVQRLKSSFPEKIAARMKNASTASESTVMVTVKRIVASIPTMLIPRRSRRRPVPRSAGCSTTDRP